jgi:ribosomal protein S21
VGSVDRRLESLERLVEGRVEARVREELEAALDRLERHMTRNGVIRVARKHADEEEPQEGGGRWQA